LDNFTYYADEFLKRYNESQNTINQGQKQKLEEQLLGLRTKLQGDYEEIKRQLGNANYVKIYREEEVTDFEAEEEFNALLTAYFEDEKDSLRNKETDIAKAEINEINEVISLVGNRKFEKIFTKHEFESLTNESIKDLINDINGVVKNELSILHTIMDNKINWAEVIFEIENVTRKVDKLYGSGYFEDLGGIVYTGYDFDASSNRVSITGQTKRDDATNFSLIANLIDELEKSGKFKDVNMRSFTKSGSFDDGYVATLKLDFFLQEKGEETEGDEKLDPLELPEDLL